MFSFTLNESGVYRPGGPHTESLLGWLFGVRKRASASPLLEAGVAETRHLPGFRNHLSPKTGPGRDRRPTRPMGPVERSRP